MSKIKQIYKVIYGLGDKLEDRVRAYFSHYPIIYALIGGVGIVLFWRGVWHTTDYIMFRITTWKLSETSIDLSYGVWWDGPVSLLIGSTILLMIGVFVSNFIGNEIIISGLKGDKKVAEKTESEVRTEAMELDAAKKELDHITKQLNNIEKTIQKTLK